MTRKSDIVDLGFDKFLTCSDDTTLFSQNSQTGIGLARFYQGRRLRRPREYIPVRLDSGYPQRVPASFGQLS